MKKSISTIILDDTIIMRLIDLKDIEILRQWKNSHKDFFFNKSNITTEAQENWFNQYVKSEEDFMFIIENTQDKIGCIGVRIYMGFADVYNVILGDKRYKGKHIMIKAMSEIIDFCGVIFKDKPICVRVLKNNPAIKWYEKQGYITDNICEDFVLMNYRKGSYSNS